ncbi:SDR family NAD(P)-dependent oxidoreductase, partial [Rhizobiaceae sp. 2RAB30]
MGLMDEKVVIVTGSARGVGRAVAVEMARAGAAVVVNDLGVSLTGQSEGDTQPALDVVQEIEAFGGRA